MKPKNYFTILDQGKAQCLICPRKCILKKDQVGHCKARQNIDGKISLIDYGRPCGLAVDPMEKKPLYHFFPGSSILSFGTYGCNLNCSFCQNHHLSDPSPDHLRNTTLTTPQNIVELAKRYQTRSIAFTYNEPTIFFEFARDVAALSKLNDIKTVAVTNGYISEEARLDFYAFIDATNIDLKSFNDSFYKKYCNAHLEPVLETLKYVAKETNTWLEITTLLIPGLNDSEKEINQMTTWIASELGPHIPLHFSAFHPDHKMMNVKNTPPSTLIKARETALKNGLYYVYTGNIHNPEGQQTYCHHCHKIIIERENFKIKNMHLNYQKECSFCGAKWMGTF